jgi:hypothetical protein
MTARAAFFCVVLAAFVSCCAAARAESDFCPASVQAIKPAGSPGPAGPATQFRYALGARSERVVESASMIADTDRGWYAWNVADIPIGKNLRSDSLRVTFPQELTIRHAWVTAAALSTKTEFPWKPDRSYPCEVPTYSNRGAAESEEGREQSRRPGGSPSPAIAALPSPSPGALETVAFPAAMPFDSIECAVPFRQARVTAAKSPEYPSGFDAGPLTVKVDIQLDEAGRILDAWIWQTSNAIAFDAAGLRAARLSTYAPAISYCQPVLGEYLFTASFQGRH